MAQDNLRSPITFGPALLLARSLSVPRDVTLTDGTVKKQYSVLLGFQKNEPAAVAVYEALRQKCLDLGRQLWPGNIEFNIPGKDGDVMNAEAVAAGEKEKAYRRGRYLLPVATDAKDGFAPPSVMVYGSPEPLRELSSLYAGCLVYVAANMATYSVRRNRGVQVYLSHVMKWADGPRLSGSGVDPRQAFAAIPAPPVPAQGGDDESPF